VLESIQCPRRAVAFAHADDLNRKRNTADKTAECKPRRYAMLAEIFMLRLEAAARAAKEAANCSRFVPITLPTAKAS
jgi:predicted TIM-barrel fold metal-dependent hydrolase